MAQKGHVHIHIWTGICTDSRMHYYILIVRKLDGMCWNKFGGLEGVFQQDLTQKAKWHTIAIYWRQRWVAPFGLECIQPFPRDMPKMKLLSYFSFCSTPHHRVISFLALGHHHYWKKLLSHTCENERAWRVLKDRPNGVLSTFSWSQFCWRSSLLTHKMYHSQW